MVLINRRELGRGFAGAAALVAAPAILRAAGGGRVVVIGGGPGGATVAGEVKAAAPELKVTLVEPQTEYTSCFYSNFYIGGMRSLASITQTYYGLKNAGVEVVHQWVAGIDLEKRLVKLKRGADLPYDRLVVAPGIDFKFEGIERYSEATAEVMPHAWKGGAQSRLLRRKLEQMDDGGTVVIAPPKMPYRCPPGPYERACAIAHYLKTAKPKSKLVILDPKLMFSKQPVFEEAFNKYYADIIELHLTNDIDDFSVTRVDARTGEIETKAGLTVKAAVANIIPQQTAGRIAIEAGLADGDWCPIEPENFQSAKAKDVYIVGDAAIAADMPKSAFAANSQGRVVAADILAELAGRKHPEGHFRNTCWSFLAPDDSVKIGADYAPGDVKGRHQLVASGSFVSQPGEGAALRKEVYDESLAWYATLTRQVYQRKA